MKYTKKKYGIKLCDFKYVWGLYSRLTTPWLNPGRVRCSSAQFLGGNIILAHKVFSRKVYKLFQLSYLYLFVTSFTLRISFHPRSLVAFVTNYLCACACQMRHEATFCTNTFECISLYHCKIDPMRYYYKYTLTAVLPIIYYLTSI